MNTKKDRPRFGEKECNKCLRSNHYSYACPNVPMKTIKYQVNITADLSLPPREEDIIATADFSQGKESSEEVCNCDYFRGKPNNGWVWQCYVHGVQDTTGTPDCTKNNPDCPMCCKKETITIIPSGRIDWCGDCQAEHGYDCPKDTPEPSFTEKTLLEFRERYQFPVPSSIEQWLTSKLEEAQKVTANRPEDLIEDGIQAERSRILGILESKKIDERTIPVHEERYRFAYQTVNMALTSLVEEIQK